MRWNLGIDSATAEEARDVVVAYQRTRPNSIDVWAAEQPTVRIMGVGWHITLPPMHTERFEAFLKERVLLVSSRDREGS